jgi:hypothetical protein
MKRALIGIESIAGILLICAVVALAQPTSSGSEHESHHAAPQPQAVGMGMMGSQGTLGCEAMMRRPGMPGPQNMMGGPGMVDMPMMHIMMSDPKTRGQMMEIHGRMMKEMGELIEKRGKELEQGK